VAITGMDTITTVAAIAAWSAGPPSPAISALAAVATGASRARDSTSRKLERARVKYRTTIAAAATVARDTARPTVARDTPGPSGPAISSVPVPEEIEVVLTGPAISTGAARAPAPAVAGFTSKPPVTCAAADCTR
jgi:hypothetical protein